MLFRAWLSGTANGALDSTGLFRGDGNGLVQIVREGQAIPGGGTFGEFWYSAATNAAMNDSGLTAFFASHTPSSYPSIIMGLYLGDGSTITPVMAVGDPAPGGNGAFKLLPGASFNLPLSINNQGKVAFTTWLDNTIGGSADDSGLFYWDGAALSEAVHEGD
ncbi:MAG: hypothetical protein R3C45_16885, partial [Phycisphaerales bacterium]